MLQIIIQNVIIKTRSCKLFICPNVLTNINIYTFTHANIFGVLPDFVKCLFQLEP